MTPLEGEQRAFYEEMGYTALFLHNGEIVGLYPFIFTVGLVVGMDEVGYKHRYCYDSYPEAFLAIVEWVSPDDPEPKGYITKK